MFATGGFLFILSRAFFVAICAFLLPPIIGAMAEPERFLFAGAFAALIVAIGGWSIFVVTRMVRRDAFGAAQEDGVKVRYADRHS
jgi:hypothetical protein